MNLIESSFDVTTAKRASAHPFDPGYVVLIIYDTFIIIIIMDTLCSPSISTLSSTAAFVRLNSHEGWLYSKHY